MTEETARDRIMWHLWQTAGLSLAQLVQRWPDWPWLSVVTEVFPPPAEEECV
jgi:hypothetical protein